MPTAAARTPDEFRMSLSEHLGELRKRLLRVVISILVLGVGALVFAKTLYGLLMLPVLLTMLALDMRELKPGMAVAAGPWIRVILAGLLTGLVVGSTEETFMRGAMQTAITRESSAAMAIGLTAPLYAATHFFARFRIAAGDVHYGSGLDMLSATLASFLHPLGIIDAFLCLTLVGVLLGMVRALTGNIAACIGLHAAWVTVIYVVRETSHRNPASPAAWLMSNYDGFIGWMVLAWTLAIGGALWWVYGRHEKRVLAI